MAKIKILLYLSLLLILTAATLQAQDRYAVYFKHKPQETLSLSRPQEFLTAKALQRRLRENVSPDSLDLPVSDRYLQSVSDAGGHQPVAVDHHQAAVGQ
ncbi:MAG: hypothetical protein B7Z16_19030, partial [Algoriphagus sp. 32-45-6]